MNFTGSYQKATKHKLLSREEEVALAQKAEEGSVNAREELICHNLRLALSIANKYRAAGLPMEVRSFSRRTAWTKILTSTRFSPSHLRPKKKRRSLPTGTITAIQDGLREVIMSSLIRMTSMNTSGGQWISLRHRPQAARLSDS